MNSMFFHRVMALMLSLMLLISSTGFSMDIHYCGGKVKDVQLYAKAAICGAKLACESLNFVMPQMKKMSCCANENFEIATDDLVIKKDSLEQLTDFQINFIVAFSKVFLLDGFEYEKASNHFLNFSPPLLIWDHNVLYQTFLI